MNNSTPYLPGAPVWARMGSYGWRPALVVRTLPRCVCIDFLSGRGGRGQRPPHLLLPRDPAARGKDKPPAKWEPKVHALPATSERPGEES